MKILALLSACGMLMLLMSLLKIQLISYCTIKDFNSFIKLDCKILVFRSRIEIHIPEHLLLNGLADLLINLAADIQQKNQAAETTIKSKKNSRYGFLKHFSQEAIRHYIVSFSGFLHLKQRIAATMHGFYRKITVHSLKAEIELGGRDAAETGILTGICWTLFGFASAKVWKGAVVEQKNIYFQVIPDFAQKKFISRIHCILTLRISHIIFIVFQFAHVMMKNRRDRRYG